MPAFRAPFVGFAPRLIAALKPQDVFATILAPANTMASAIAGNTFTPDLIIDKDRVAAGDWSYRDTSRGTSNTLASNTTAAQTAFAGYSGTNNRVAYLFKEGPNFFKRGTINHVNGTANLIDLSSLGVVGMVEVKRYDGISGWPVWHRSLAAGNNLALNSFNAQSTTNAYISVSGTTMTFAAAAPTGNYVYYALAHNTINLIQCDSALSDGDGQISVPLNIRTQLVIYKSNTTSSVWNIIDTTRGWDGTNNRRLYPAQTDAETTAAGGTPSAGGFTLNSGDGIPTAQTIIFCAIQAPV